MNNKIPTLRHTGTTTATTYHLRPVAEDTLHRDFGWALCTINDVTGELQIMSDWGDWAYRWSSDPGHLGAPTLSHFIARRDPVHGYSDTYLADKLTSGDDGKRKRRQFAPEATVADLRKSILEARRTYVRGKLTKDVARAIWDDLGEIEHEDNEQEFHRLVYEINDPSGRIITGDVYESFVHEYTDSYLILRDGIIPALVRTVSGHLAKADWYASATARYTAEVA